MRRSGVRVRSRRGRVEISLSRRAFAPYFATLERARQIVKDLLEAGHNNALVPLVDVEEADTVASIDNPEQLMTIEEAERHTDKVIRVALLALCGQDVPEGVDPVDFIYGGIPR